MQPRQTQMLRELIDEKLKLQEAKRLKVEVKDQDIVDQLNQIAQQNNTTVDGIKKELEGPGRIDLYPDRPDKGRDLVERLRSGPLRLGDQARSGRGPASHE